MESNCVTIETILALKDLEKHQNVSNSSSERLKSATASQVCCFDAANAQSASWTAHEFCRRCEPLNQLNQGEPRNGSIFSIEVLQCCCKVPRGLARPMLVSIAVMD